MLKRLVILILTLFITILAPAGLAYSKVTNKQEQLGIGSSLVDQLNANIRKQEELRRKISDAQSKEKSLSSEIDYLDNQISLTGLQIEETETRLTQLSGDISKVSGQLESTKQDLDYTQGVADVRVRTIYKQSYVGSFGAFLGSDNFNDFLVRQKYTEVVRSQDLKLLQTLEDLKKDYTNQKTDLEDKKSKEQVLKSELDKRKADLASQQGSKRHILGVTKNDERVYQNLLAQSIAEQQAIAAALRQTGVNLGPVRRGEVVAFQGSTGCSTGSHLHFALFPRYPPSYWEAMDPQPYLNSGTLGQPLDPPYTITQTFYGGFIGIQHRAIDMVKYDGAPVKAAMDGVATRKTVGGCYKKYIRGYWEYKLPDDYFSDGTTATSGQYTGNANLIEIKQSNGWVTWYLHVK